MNFTKIFEGNFFLRVNINSPLWLVPTYTSQYYWGFSWTHIQLSSQSQFRIHPYSRINAYNWVRLYDGFALYFRILAYVCSEKLSEFDHITVYRNVRLESYKANSYFFSTAAVMDVDEDFVLNRQRKFRHDPTKPRPDGKKKSIVGRQCSETNH